MASVVFSLPGEQEFFALEGPEEEWRDPAQTGFLYQDFNSGKCFCIPSVEAKTVNDLNLAWQSEEQSAVSITKEVYLDRLHHLIDRLKKGDLQKLVFSRQYLQEHATFSIASFLQQLRSSYPASFIYALNSDQFGLWIGASPELLLKRRGRDYKTSSLAGTKAKGQGEWTIKEIEEQQLVTDFILEVLKEKNCNKIEINGPRTVNAGPVEHLKTSITFQSDSSIHTLLDHLSPTPAVCGIPRKESKEYILGHEGYDRQLYTGLIGYHSKDRSDVFVNLRCMKRLKNGLMLFLGGGITSRSNANDEWEETNLKAKTMLDLL